MVGGEEGALTVATHADRDALLEAAVLTAVAVDAHDVALLVLEAGPVLDLLLDRAPEEALASLARVHAVVEAARLVAAHSTQYGIAVELCNEEAGFDRISEIKRESWKYSVCLVLHGAPVLQ